MRHLMMLLILPCLLAAETGLEPVFATGSDGTQQTYFRVNTGNGYLLNDPLPQSPPRLVSDTGVLWVDRNHRFAIGQGAAVSPDGRHIFVNWYLNAQRASYYRTLANEIPVWESPGDFTWAYNGQQLGISRNGAALAMSSVAETRKWTRSSSVPDWAYTYPAPGTGFARVSDDGSTVAAVQGNTLVVLDPSTGNVRWTAPVSEGGRLQGLDITPDGAIVAVTVYDSCMVYEDGSRRGQVPIGTSSSGTQYAAAISADGSRLVTGDFQGRLKLWAYDSEAYVLRWQAAVGTPWVAGVAISADGSTIACGTGYQNGRLCLFDSSSSTPLWVYQNYGSVGAYVPSVALSADGSRIAACSWGDTALAGTFRVFTIHNRSDTTPLVAVTRDQEPGSLFGCDISADGTMATATGKAVHAQRMGNGGEVYAVLVGSTEPVNVGIHSVTSPTPYLELGSPVTPVALVRNYGDEAAAVPTHLVVYDDSSRVLHSDSVTTPSIGPDEMAEATFSTFTPTVYGRYLFVFFTALSGDSCPGDDTTALLVRCYHDATVRGTQPAAGGEVGISLPIRPQMLLGNRGSYTEGVDYLLTYEDSSGAVVYSDSGTSPAIAPDQTAWVQLAEWTPGYVGRYRFTAVVRVADDLDPGNDTLRGEFRVTYEIMYDDGVPEAYYWVGRRDNDKFYVRFTPTIPAPFRLVHGRVMVNLANQPFDYIMICPGTNDKPDTLQPLQVVNNVSTPTAPGWIDFDLDVPRATDDNVWMILHWPSNSPGLGVGADATPPIDLRSYLSSNQDTFRLWTTHDWLVRLTQSPEVGIADAGPARQSQFRLANAGPNPFGQSTALEYELDSPASVSVSVYDRAGCLVATPVNGPALPGRHTLVWNGTDRRGARVAPGVYFVCLRDPASERSAMTKVTLVR